MISCIDSFTEDYFFLSNFYDATVSYGGYTFRNTEAAFQAMKCPERAGEFVNLSAAQAKKLGRQVKLRPDWEQIKDSIMYEVCLAKFMQHSDLKERLVNTGDLTLIEGNTWVDKYWGVCNGEGQNKLGEILMRIRDKIRIPLTLPAITNVDALEPGKLYAVHIQFPKYARRELSSSVAQSVGNLLKEVGIKYVIFLETDDLKVRIGEEENK